MAIKFQCQFGITDWTVSLHKHSNSSLQLCHLATAKAGGGLVESGQINDKHAGSILQPDFDLPSQDNNLNQHRSDLQ